MSSLGRAMWFADFCILHWHPVSPPTVVEKIPFKHTPCVWHCSQQFSHTISFYTLHLLTLSPPSLHCAPATLAYFLSIQACWASDFCTGCPSAWNTFPPDSSLVCSSSSFLFKFKSHLLLSFTLTIPGREPSLPPAPSNKTSLPSSALFYSPITLTNTWLKLAC